MQVAYGDILIRAILIYITDNGLVIALDICIDTMEAMLSFPCNHLADNEHTKLSDALLLMGRLVIIYYWWRLLPFFFFGVIQTGLENSGAQTDDREMAQFYKI